MPFRVRPASLDDDVDVVLALLAEAAAWTAAIGHENWPKRFPRRNVETKAEAGTLYLVELAGETVGTVTFQWSDPRFWGAAGDDGSAGYVHRLVVQRAHAGKGLGGRVLDWADEQVRARGRTSLRLDVVCHNAPLRCYYETAGFAYARDVTGEWELRDGTRQQWCTSLYERPTT